MSKSQDSFFFFGTLCRSLQCIPCLSHVSPPPLRVRRPCRGCEAAPGSWTSGPWAPRGSSPGLRLVQFMAQLCSAMVLNLAKKETTKAISNRNQQRQQWLNLHHGIPWVTVYHPSISLASTPNVLPPAPGPPLPQLRWATEVCLRVKQPHFCWMRAQCS